MSHATSAAKIFPACILPVGEGAKRPLGGRETAGDGHRPVREEASYEGDDSSVVACSALSFDTVFIPYVNSTEDTVSSTT